MIATQPSGKQVMQEEPQLWEVEYSHSFVPVGEEDSSSQRDSILVAAISEEDARTQAKTGLASIQPHRIEQVRRLNSISYQGKILDILLQPREVSAA